MKLKKEHVILEMKYQEPELVSEDIGSSGHANAREVTKTNSSTSCDDLIDEPKVLLNDENIASSSTSRNAIIYDHYLVTISCLVIEVLFAVTKKIFGHRRLFFL
jgi:hypothetical protein